MAKASDSKQKRTERVTNRSKPSLPIWVLGVIVLAVFVGSYLILNNMEKQEPTGTSLPLEVSVDEAASYDQKDWFFLDVREPSEWEDAHIPYATLIPLGELTARLNEIPKNMNIIVVCHSGNRSAVGRDLLLKSGFASVTSMAGGMSTWQAKGYPIVTGP